MTLVIDHIWCWRSIENEMQPTTIFFLGNMRQQHQQQQPVIIVGYIWCCLIENNGCNKCNLVYLSIIHFIFYILAIWSASKIEDIVLAYVVVHFVMYNVYHGHIFTTTADLVYYCYCVLGDANWGMLY